MAKRQSASKLDLDDWEEVADDYSVVSLSSSDEEEDPAPVSSSSKVPRDAPPCYTEARANKYSNTTTTLSQSERIQYSPSEATEETSHNAVLHKNPISSESIPPTPSNTFGTSLSPSALVGQNSRGGPSVGQAASTSAAAATHSSRNEDKAVAETPMQVGGFVGHSDVEASGTSDCHSKLIDWLETPLRRQATQSSVPSYSVQTTRDKFDAMYKASGDWDIEKTADHVGRLTMETGPNDDTHSSSKQKGTLAETLNLDDSSMNPVCISQTLESLYNYIADTLNRTDGQLVGLDVTSNVAGSCQALMGQIRELRPILAEYATQWEKPMGAKDIPLDPSLSLWLCSLRTIVSKLRKKSRLWLRYANTEEGKKIRSAVLMLDAALDEHIKEMDDFLPIIQVDFNDYRTQNMPFPREVIDDVNKTPKIAGNSPPRPTDRLSQVRTALYSLKDQVQKTVDVVAISQSFLPAAASNTASDIVRRLGSTFNAVSLALTNNGSEWLESDLGRAHVGLLSHAEFSNLDPMTLYDFRVRLQQICNLVSNPADHHQWTEEMVRTHYVCMLVEQQQLDALSNIASVLEELMMPKHLKTRTEFDDFMKEM